MPICKTLPNGCYVLRVGRDVGIFDDSGLDAVKRLINTDNRKLVPVAIKVMRGQIAIWKKQKIDKADNYDYAYLGLMEAQSLPQLLIAISKALNAIHDTGSLMHPDEDSEETNLLNYGPPFTIKELDMLSNLNYRKLDKELQQELQ